LVVLGLLGGCITMPETRSRPAPSQAAPKKPAEEGPLPSDFEDIRIPRELKEIKDDTFFMQTPGFSAGVLSMRGRVKRDALIAFFNTQMEKDNWRLVSFFKSPRSLMIFNKENRWCIINITEKNFYTYVEIWVAPTVSFQESGLLK